MGAWYFKHCHSDAEATPPERIYAGTDDGNRWVERNQRINVQSKNYRFIEALFALQPFKCG